MAMNNEVEEGNSDCVSHILLVDMNVVRHSDSVVHNSRSSSRRRTPVRQTILRYMFGHRIRDSKKLAEGGKQKACKGTEHHIELL